MARSRSVEDDGLEPILPRHPPTAPPEPPAGELTTATGDAVAVAAGAIGGRRSWERWLLLGCAVVATAALVVCAFRLDAIAHDQRLMACQAESYLVEQIDNSSGRFRQSDRVLLERLAKCIGMDPDDSDGARD